MGMEYKSATTGTLLGHDDEQGIVEALVSVTGIVDEDRDLIVPGAYAETIKNRKTKGVRFHDWKRPAAKTLVQEEWMPGDPRLPKTLPDGRPWPKEAGAVYVKGQYNLKTQDGRDGYENAKFFGPEGQWSIGYQAIKSKTKRRSDGVRVIGGLDWYEWSDVLHGAAPLTTTLGVKTGQAPEGFTTDVFGGEPAEGFSPLPTPVGAGGDRGTELLLRTKADAALTDELHAEKLRRLTNTALALTDEEKTAELARQAEWQSGFDAARDQERARRMQFKAAGFDPLLADNEPAGGEAVDSLPVEYVEAIGGSLEELRALARKTLAAHLGTKVLVLGTWPDRVVVADDGGEVYEAAVKVTEAGEILVGAPAAATVVDVAAVADGPDVAALTLAGLAEDLEAISGLTAAATKALLEAADDASYKDAAQRLREAAKSLLGAVDITAAAGAGKPAEEPEGESGGEGGDGGEPAEKTPDEPLDAAQVEEDMAWLRAALA